MTAAVAAYRTREVTKAVNNFHKSLYAMRLWWKLAHEPNPFFGGCPSTVMLYHTTSDPHSAIQHTKQLPRPLRCYTHKCSIKPRTGPKYVRKRFGRHIKYKWGIISFKSYHLYGWWQDVDRLNCHICMRRRRWKTNGSPIYNLKLRSHIWTKHKAAMLNVDKRGISIFNVWQATNLL